jgi:hypothetical protein
VNSSREYEHDANKRYADRNDVGDGPRLGPRHNSSHSRYCRLHQISALLRVGGEDGGCFGAVTATEYRVALVTNP